MTVYHNFIGIDISKFNFVVAKDASKNSQEYTNDPEGIAEFLKDYATPDTLYILETTGGYEMEVLSALCLQNLPVHRANTRKVKNFVRSLGNGVKTDSLDAKALARYGRERHDKLELTDAPSQKSMELNQLTQRRHDLVQMLVAEKNRVKGPATGYIKNSCNTMIKAISRELESVKLRINNLIESDVVLQARKETLMTIPGIGEIIANDLVSVCPELGTLFRRQVASLAGVAPRSNESGQYIGYRSTGHGRTLVKPLLFLAAMAARNSNSILRGFYESLISRGKEKMVALVALMRKVIVIANARLRDLARLGVA